MAPARQLVTAVLLDAFPRRVIEVAVIRLLAEDRLETVGRRGRIRGDASSRATLLHRL